MIGNTGHGKCVAQALVNMSTPPSEVEPLLGVISELEEEYGIKAKVVDPNDLINTYPIRIGIPDIPEPKILTNPYDFEFEYGKKTFGCGHSTKSGRTEKQIRKDRKRKKNKKTHKK